MKGEKINFIINSKNRDILINPSVSTVDVVIPSGLLQLQQDEVFYLNVNGFNCFKNFYNCQTGYNSTFQLIYYDIYNVPTITQYNIQQGNFDVYQLTDNLNSLLINNVVVAYNSITNTLSFTRTTVVSNSQNTLYLNIINSDAFLGFPLTQRNNPILLPSPSRRRAGQPPGQWFVWCRCRLPPGSPPRRRGPQPRLPLPPWAGRPAPRPRRRLAAQRPATQRGRHGRRISMPGLSLIHI